MICFLHTKAPNGQSTSAKWWSSLGNLSVLDEENAFVLMGAYNGSENHLVNPWGPERGLGAYSEPVPTPLCIFLLPCWLNWFLILPGYTCVHLPGTGHFQRLPFIHLICGLLALRIAPHHCRAAKMSRDFGLLRTPPGAPPPGLLKDARADTELNDCVESFSVRPLFSHGSCGKQGNRLGRVGQLAG